MAGDAAYGGIRRLRLSHILMLLLIVVALGFVYVWSRIGITRFEYEIAKGMNQKERLEEEIDKLRLEVATLKAPQRIEEIARKELGMTYPNRDQVVFLQ